MADYGSILNGYSTLLFYTVSIAAVGFTVELNFPIITPHLYRAGKRVCHYLEEKNIFDKPEKSI